MTFLFQLYLLYILIVPHAKLCNLYSYYDFENLNFKSDKLIFKYKMLDYILIKLIKENENTFTLS